MKNVCTTGIIVILFTGPLAAQVCENCGIGVNNPGSKLEVKGCDDSTLTSSLNVTDSAGASLFYIRDDGNIGMGTTSLGSYQTYRLTMKQLSSASGTGFRLLNADESKSGQFWVGTGGVVFDAEGTSNLHLRTGGIDRLLIGNSTGFVGIGSTGADRKLDVLDASNPQLRLTYTDGSVYTDLQTTSSGYLFLNPSGGNVGIGTSSPTNILHIDENDAQGGLLVTGGNGGSYLAQFRRDIGSDGTITVQSSGGDPQVAFDPEGGGTAWRIGIDDSNSDLLAFTAAGAIGDAGADKMVITTSGNVGIGTTAPGAKFEVNGTGGSTVDFLVNGRMQSNNNDGGLWVSSDRFFGGHSTNKMGFYNGGAWRITVQSDGKVGVGTATPGSGFHTNVGQVRFADPASSTRYFYTNPNYGGLGDLPAGVYYSTAITTSGEGISMVPTGAGSAGVKLVAGVYTGSAWKTVWETQNESGGTLPTLRLVKNGGKVSIGLSTANTKLDVDGAISLRASSTINLTADNQVVTVGDRSYLRLSSDNATGSNRTAVLTQGLQAGQVLTIEFTGTNQGELLDDGALSGGGNQRLSANLTLTQYDTIHLIWNGTDWVETSRSVN